jgi:hypothetical protein
MAHDEWVDWRGEPQPPAFVLKRECDTFNADVRVLTFVRSFVHYSSNCFLTCAVHSCGNAARSCCERESKTRKCGKY